jgi:hypothetical protein
MNQLSNPYNSNTKLGGKGKGEAPRHLGDALARKDNCSDMRLGQDPRRERRQPPLTTMMRRWGEEENRHDHGISMMWLVTTVIGESL